MLLSNEQMNEAARSIARGIPVKDLLDKYEEVTRSTLGDEIEGMSSKALRATLSDELNRANPRSPRWVENRFGEIHRIEVEMLRNEYAENFAGSRDKFMTDLNTDIAYLADIKAQAMKAVGGLTGELEPAQTPDEQLKYLSMVIQIQKQEIQLKGLNLKLQQAFGANLNTPIEDPLK